jgi:hypothetical protein
MPTLMTAYKYAKLRAIGSFDALNKATASVPIKTDILRYETQAIYQKKEKIESVSVWIASKEAASKRASPLLK